MNNVTLTPVQYSEIVITLKQARDLLNGIGLHNCFQAEGMLSNALFFLATANTAANPPAPEYGKVEENTQWPGKGTVWVKGLSGANPCPVGLNPYSDNRVFHQDGKRWVLQSCLGFDCKEDKALYWAEQHD